MSNLFRGSLFFISGAAIASFITYKMVEKKFKDIADEEIASVKDMYERKLKKAELDKAEDSKEESIKIFNPNPDIAIAKNPYSSLVTDLGYSNKKEEEKENVNNDNNIVVIPPEDFGEYGYKCESLTYYTDGVLTYDNDKKITDIEKIVGPVALHSFGEYEDDSVFVRNHGMKTDFEILKEYRKYSDVVLGETVEDTADDE